MASRPPPPSYKKHQNSKRNLSQQPEKPPPSYQKPPPKYNQQAQYAAPPQYGQPQQPVYFDNNTMNNVQRVMQYNNAQQPSFTNIFNPMANNNIQYQQPMPNYQQYPPNLIQQPQQPPGYNNNNPPIYAPNAINKNKPAPPMKQNSIVIFQTEEDEYLESSDSDTDVQQTKSSKTSNGNDTVSSPISPPRSVESPQYHYIEGLFCIYSVSDV